MSAYRVAVFASGRGTNLSALIGASREGVLKADIGLVVVSRADAGALQRAREASIPAHVVSETTHPDPDDRDQALLDLLRDHDIDLVALAGYVKKLSPAFLSGFGGPVVNIHPSLLPSFGGKGMYGRRVFEATMAYGVKVTGVTIHLVDEQYDHGPIVAQQVIDLRDDDTVQTLATRIHRVEHELYPRVIRWFAEGRIDVEGRRVRVHGRPSG